jgi:uncharacterized membrane protein
MKKFKTFEAMILGITLIPLGYLGYIWNTLPAKVPMHYNIEGKADRFGSKMELLLTVIILPLVLYLIFKFLPFLDPKKKIQKMEGKFNSVRLILAVFVSLVLLYIINSTSSNSLSQPHFFVALLGMLFFTLGNFFKTIKPNYFMGIRTPWTLENEQVWKETHILAGKMWFIGGLLIVVFAFLLDPPYHFYVALGITFLITVIPIGFSYKRYRELKTKSL